MIDSNGYLRCANCNTILGRNLQGRVEIICYRSNCKRNNVFATSKTESFIIASTTIIKRY